MSALKRFLLSFVICLAVFALLANFVTDYFEDILFNQDTDPEKIEIVSGDGEKKEDEKLSDETEVSGKSFGALVIGKDLSTNETDAIILVKVDKEQKKLMVCSIPTDTEYEISGYDKADNAYTGSLSFKDTVDTFGTSYLVNKITALTGIKIDYHATLSVSAAKSLINEFCASGVTYTVPEAMEYDDLIEDISLKEGAQSLNGNRALQLLRYRTYESGNGDMKRCTNQISFVKKFVEASLSGSNPLKTALLNESSRKNLLSKVTTNVTGNDILENLDLVFTLSEYDFDSVTFPYFRAMITSENVSALHQTFRDYR